MTKHPRKTALLVSTLAVSLPSGPTELDTQQEATAYGDGEADSLACPSRLQSNNAVCARKITITNFMQLSTS
jgi:hypothetical protein